MTNVVLTDTIPVGSTFISATLPYTLTGDSIRWDFPSLEVIDTRSVKLAVKADLTAFGAITNSDYAVRSDQVTLVRGEPVTTLIEEVNSLELNKVASASMVVPGDLITYTLSITNTHEFIPTTNVVLTDTLPAGSTFVSATAPYTRNGRYHPLGLSQLGCPGYAQR